MAFLTAIRAQQRAGQSLGGMVKNLVIDGGFNHGLTITSTQWEVFVGFTYLLPHRLWALITVVIPSRLSPFCYDFIAGTSLSQRLSSVAVEL